MIGVYANTKSHDVVREFFELFKTPWEFAQSGKRYEIVVVSDNIDHEEGTVLTIVYSDTDSRMESKEELEDQKSSEPLVLNFRSSQIPIFGSVEFFSDESKGELIECKTSRFAMRTSTAGQQKAYNIGYNLFSEVRYLLVKGQPINYGEYPTLDLHIDLMRTLIVDSGIELFEIPPAPQGHPYIVCLSHDVDHPGIRFHKFDHTIMGFLVRGSFGSILNFLKRRTGLRGCVRNFCAVLTFPFAQMGWIKDTWSTFDDYVELEDGKPSTFFVIPFKGDPGVSPVGVCNKKRSSAYGVSDIKGELNVLLKGEKEICVHGINAWDGVEEGKRESVALAPYRRQSEVEIGIRMHWLYFREESHRLLEEAGYTYDSTIGYNETVGFKAGTLQAFKPVNTEKLLELPLNIMDTSIFYPAHLGLSLEAAKERIGLIFEQAKRFGGQVTINWHDRSLAPERNWGELYEWMIERAEKDGAWFASMSESCGWFRRRRNAKLAQDGSGRCRLIEEQNENVLVGPELDLRVNRGSKLMAS